MQSITSKIWLVSGSVEQYKSYFMAVWQYGQYYSHHYRGQINALLPDALWPRAICVELSMAPGRGIILSIYQTGTK